MTLVICIVLLLGLLSVPFVFDVPPNPFTKLMSRERERKDNE